VDYVDKSLIAGEHVVYKTGLHWIVMLGSLVMALILAVPGVYLLIRSLSEQKDEAAAQPWMTGVGIGLIVVAAIIFLRGLVRKNAVEMAVTNKRVIIKKGLMTRNTFELLLSKVESIGVEETIAGRMFGYGTVVIHGTGGSPEPFRRMDHPVEFRRQVQQQIEDLTTPPAAGAVKTV
jgi:uncharacterized membrane protein YdbT with pleckstrin-like domain